MPAKRDNIELVWSISELTSILGRTTNLDGFLHDVVDNIAEHMQSDVCSIYLLDETSRELVLRATRGLDRESVGTVRLALGEGITGAAVKELRPIREARASTNPLYKFVPSTNEEEFESFLAVPIRRGLNRIGALVVQHHRADYFVRQDTRALQAIAGQLASTLGNVESLVEIRGGGETARPRESTSVEFIPCQPASGGVATGRLIRIYADAQPAGRSPDPTESESSSDHLAGDEDAFKRALELTDRQINAIHRDLDERIADIASLIFGSHLLMLHDAEFSGEMIRAIQSGTPADHAIRSTVDRYVSLLSASSNPRTQETANDIRDLGARLIRNLHGTDDDPGDLRGQVVIAHELFPSDLVRLAAEHAEGLILTGGGATAHMTILARSLQIPTVLARDEHVDGIAEGTVVALDAHEGQIHISPSDAIIERFRAAREAQDVVETVPAGPAHTADGVAIGIQANVNILHDVDSALAAGAQGIGLYRSEFPFLVRNDFPSEDEQFAIYRRIVTRFNHGPITLRTLDIGGDKVLSETQHLEGNPFLGLRGIRFSLAHPELFDEQLRAILRAGFGRELRVLLPMISSMDELEAARVRLDAALDDLAGEGIEHNDSPALGVMIELPSAVECVDALAGLADFMSIGSNDLVMYMLAVDRTNEQVEHLYEPFHPAVLRAVEKTVRACERASIPLSICGEAGADPVMAAFLVGTGLRTISADPARLPAVRDAVGRFTLEAAASFSRELLAAGSVASVRESIDSWEP